MSKKIKDNITTSTSTDQPPINAFNIFPISYASLLDLLNQRGIEVSNKNQLSEIVTTPNLIANSNFIIKKFAPKLSKPINENTVLPPLLKLQPQTQFVQPLTNNEPRQCLTSNPKHRDNQSPNSDPNPS